jgi:hypothetical protein
MHVRRALLKMRPALTVSTAVWAGCSGHADEAVLSAPAPGLVDAGLPGLDAAPFVPAPCAPDNPYCVVMGTNPSCGSVPIDLDPAGVNIMVAIEGAASMATHWPRVQEALRGLVQANPAASVGLQVFWGETVTTIDEGLAKSNWCGQTQNRMLEVGAHGPDELAGFLGAAPPGPSFIGGLFETSPVIEPLNYYLTHDSPLGDPSRSNYLVLISNGNDNCFGSVYSRKEEKLLAYEKLAVELGKRNIRLVPIGFDAAAKPDASGRWGTTPGRTDLDVLGTMLEHGGSGMTDVPKVDDPAKLSEVLGAVGQAVRNCRFTIPAALDPTLNVNPFALDFTVNGRVVPRDRTATDGWDFVHGDTSQVEVFGPACTALRSGAALAAQKTCRNDVCGTAAIQVETKPRAVLFLLDSSASRIECVDGTFGCLVSPNVPADIFPRTTISFWEAVEHALSQSLIAPINDDIDFGVQFFPSKNAGTFSCDVATAPEVPVGDGSEISIMSQMLEKLPLGLSPVVASLESVAAAPGRLADPGVEGAVVVLTDGGDNCAGVPQEELVTRLGVAAQSLSDRGVPTYVVRYGSPSGKTPEQDAQLRAIVAHGSSATSDPADMSQTPYVDAKDDRELNAALARIADVIATCSFSVGELPSDTDKARTNLYLNGGTVPFDAQGTKLDGWSWSDDGSATITLYGAACDAFKHNRKTSVVVELGCVPEVLK